MNRGSCAIAVYELFTQSVKVHIKITDTRSEAKYITCRKLRTKKVSEIFKRPKILRYSKITLVSRNKLDVIRKGWEMVIIVKTVTGLDIKPL